MLREWIGKGFQADMRWMENPERREDPAALFPRARSVIVAGLSCYRHVAPPGPGEGRIARFALGPDYHELMGEKLVRLLGRVRESAGAGGRIAVDNSPAMDRALARRAGLGWPGKSSCLISSENGPWLLLGELMVDAEAAPDDPVPSRCGECVRCVASCPTGAIVAPGVVDAGRCVAYLTVELKGPVPRPLRHLVGDRLFGCDTCQECCPWSRFAEEPLAFPRRLPDSLPAAECLGLDERSFRKRFAGTSLERTGRARIARNAALVLGNLRPPGAGEVLERALEDPDALVRGHAAWALGRCGRRGVLAAGHARERDEWARDEFKSALEEAAA